MPAGSFLVSGSMRYIVGYNNVIRAGSDSDGLYLRFWPRLAHPPLFIPWEDVFVKPPRRFLLFRMQTLMLGRAACVPFTIKAGDAERLLANVVSIETDDAHAAHRPKRRR